jgi:hypothetical protein
MNRSMISTINALVITSLLALSAAAKPQGRPDASKPKLTVGTKVTLACKNPGSHQDVAKTPSVTNTTGAAIAKGKKIYWSASDGDKGTLTLDQNLAPNASVKVMGSAGNGYSCQAWMLQ